LPIERATAMCYTTAGDAPHDSSIKYADRLGCGRSTFRCLALRRRSHRVFRRHRGRHSTAAPPAPARQRATNHRTWARASPITGPALLDASSCRTVNNPCQTLAGRVSAPQRGRPFHAQPRSSRQQSAIHGARPT
jgi:hypothetical protein